jgi:senataxin
MSSKSKEDEILSRQRDIAMIRAAKAVESKLEPSNIDKRKAPPPNKPNPVRSLSSLTGLPSKGSEKNPICIDDRSTKQPPTTKRARSKTNADAILAQARQRVSSEEDKSSEPQLKRPSVKRPSLRNQSCALAAAPHNSGSSNENTNEKKPAASQKGSLSSILLSNKVTAKYLSKDAPKLLKHYPKVEPNDYWKNLRAWDFVRDLNEKVGEGKKVGNSKDGNAAAAAAGKRSRDDSKLTDVKSDSSVKDQKETKLQPVPNRFSSHREYCAIWSPLLMNETRAQLLSDAISDIPYWKSKPEKQPIRIKVEVRKKDLDGEYDAIGLVVKQVIGECTAERMFMSNDVVCLVQEEKTVWDASKGALDVDINNSSKPWCIVGHLEHTRRSMENLVITVSRKVWKQFGCGEMTFLKVGCNITSLREFTALCRMDRLPLADYILCTKMNVEEDEESELTSDDAKDEKMAKKQILQKMGGPIALGKGFVDYAQHKFNLSQLKGISASAAEYGNGGFTLVSSYSFCLHCYSNFNWLSK